jgi:hypothetical protein
MRASAPRWAHRRRLTDVLRECAARGDHISVDAGGQTFDGVVCGVGDDRIDIATTAGIVSVHSAVADVHGAACMPIAIRRSRVAHSAGRRFASECLTFRARLYELEDPATCVRVGLFGCSAEYAGSLVVGADHVIVCGHAEVVVPTAWIAYVFADPFARA